MFYRFAKLLCRMVLFILRRWEVRGADNFPHSGGLVVICNHTSYWDPIVVGCAINRVIHFMAKAELFTIPLLGIIIKFLHAFPVKRGGSDRNAIRTALQLLVNGKVVGIFPEGTRSKTGEILDPHLGAAMLALKAGVPILPVAVVGTRGFTDKVRVLIGKPIEFPEYKEKKAAKQDLQEVSNRVMEEVTRLMYKF